MLIVLTWLTPLFFHLPKTVLGAIVIVAVSGFSPMHIGLAGAEAQTETDA
jgi:MFS superfamily sulfate permease-like transporter